MVRPCSLTSGSYRLSPPTCSPGLRIVEMQIKLILLSDMVLLYFQWIRHQGMVKKDMFSELPLTFQAELSLILNKHVLEKVYSFLYNTYWRNCDPNIYDGNFQCLLQLHQMFDKVLTLQAPTPQNDQTPILWGRRLKV